MNFRFLCRIILSKEELVYLNYLVTYALKEKSRGCIMPFTAIIGARLSWVIMGFNAPGNISRGFRIFNSLPYALRNGHAFQANDIREGPSLLRRSKRGLISYIS
jgi:hypothetical protein